LAEVHLILPNKFGFKEIKGKEREFICKLEE
jgi:hypothetical protein